MALLELVAPTPDWTTALSRTLQRPPGVPERRRRAADEAGAAPAADGEGGGRRLSDDLAWLRAAIDEPGEHGLEDLPDTSAVGLWRADAGSDRFKRLCRLRDRGVLDAAGFLLHEPGE
jgi:hypothetical protein